METLARGKARVACARPKRDMPAELNFTLGVTSCGSLELNMPNLVHVDIGGSWIDRLKVFFMARIVIDFDRSIFTPLGRRRVLRGGTMKKDIRCEVEVDGVVVEAREVKIGYFILVSILRVFKSRIKL